MGKTVDICGIPHKIVEKEYIEGDGRVLGEIEYSSCTISLRKDQTPEMYQQTLIHEVVHGMLFQIGRGDLSNDETFVQSLAMAINLTFRLRDEEHDNLKGGVEE